MNLIDLKKNPELIPVIEWWEKDGKQTVIWKLEAQTLLQYLGA